MEHYKKQLFSFGGKDDAEKTVSVETRYLVNCDQYGFITEETRSKVKNLQYPELYSGFEPAYWAQGETLGVLEDGLYGVRYNYAGDGFLPITFAAKVSIEGNYRCEICVYTEQNLDCVYVYLGRRTLVYQGPLEGGRKHTFSGMTNVCPIIPRNTSGLHVMDAVTVSVLGKGLELVSLSMEESDCPTIYIAGDSTVTDQPAAYPYSPVLSYCGWGQMLSAYVGSRMAVSNHAHSGLTTESMRSEKHYDTILSRIRPGDYCFFQFGHNDQKLDHLKAERGYRERMLTYISEVREKGATPVVVSPLARNSWKGVQGVYNDLLEDYARVCRELCMENGTVFIDLHEKSKKVICESGRERAKKYFFPSDYTHSNDWGAYVFAGMIFSEWMEKDERIRNEYRDLPVRLWEEAGNLKRIAIPPEYAQKSPKTEASFLDHLERENEPLTRVEALDLVIKVMKFFPTNVYNDYFEDVYSHETYAGTVEAAIQNGIIPEYLLENRKLEPNREITFQEFIDIVKAGYAGRMSGKLHFESSCDETASFILRSEAAHILKQVTI